MNNAALSRLKYITKLKLSKIFNRSFLPPIEVLLTLTNRCNLRCTMCNFYKFETKPSDELTTEQFNSIVSQVADLKVGTIVFSGGEPFLRDDLFEIIHFATKCGIANTVLLTNGTIINEEIIRKINESGLKAICISIDGLEEAHDSIRGKGTFRKSIHFIETLQKRCPQVALNVTTTIMNRNLEDIPKLLSLYEKMKIKQISFQPVIPDNTDWNNDNEKRQDLLVPQERFPLLDYAIDEIINYKKKNGIIIGSYSFLELIKHYFKGDLGTMKRKLNCFEGFKRFTVTVGGRLWLCGTEMKLNIVENGLRKCWDSSEVRKKRRAMLKCKLPCLQACAFE